VRVAGVVQSHLEKMPRESAAAVVRMRRHLSDSHHADAAILWTETHSAMK
jgi:hypothetical protein